MAVSSSSSSNCLWKTPTAPKQKVNAYCLSMCVLFLNWCMFQWNYCEELSCCQSWLWRFFRTVLRSVIFIKPSVLVCRWAVLGLAVSLTGCDIWCCLCRFSAPGLPFGVKASQSCRELLCPPQVVSHSASLRLLSWVIRVSYSILSVLSFSY